MLDYSNVAVIYHGMQMYYIIIYRNNKDEITTDTRYIFGNNFGKINAYNN